MTTGTRRATGRCGGRAVAPGQHPTGRHLPRGRGEFLVAVTTGHDGAEPIATELCRAIAELPHLTASTGRSTVLIGRFRDGDFDATLEELIAAADAAMYTAKRSGGNQVRSVFSTKRHDAAAGARKAGVRDVEERGRRRAADALFALAEEVKADLLVVGSVGLNSVVGRLVGSCPGWSGVRPPPRSSSSTPQTDQAQRARISLERSASANCQNGPKLIRATPRGP